MDEYRKGEGFQASAAERARSLREEYDWIHEVADEEERKRLSGESNTYSPATPT